MANYETFSTTADVGIRIQGKGYGELLGAALNGLNLLYFDELPQPTSEPEVLPQRYSYEFFGDSCENILVNLLAEVVFLLQDKSRITVGLAIHEANETYINMELLTIPLDREINLEIKSVTYHNLAVQENEGVKSATIIFDV